MSEERDPNFRLGIDSDPMTHTCGYSPTPEVAGANCNQPAIIHLWFGTGFDDPEASAGMACAAHADYAITHSYDWHELGATCGLPDTLWMNALGLTGSSWCIWPAEQEAEDSIRLETESETKTHV